MGEHRKEARKKLMAFTPVYDSKKKVLLGYVGDLTLLGVMVIGERVVAVNEERVLKIDLPNELPDIVNATHITIPARVAWCRQDEGPNSFNIGFEFTEISAEHTQLIHAILERYQFR